MAATAHGRYWIGIDIGGTFADYVIFDAKSNDMTVFKSPAPRSTRAEAVLAGVKAALERDGVAGADVAFLGHGTTVATNAMLSREAQPTAAITTRGFGDMLLIRRQTRRDTFDYYADFPPPVVARSDTAEVGERLDAFGNVVEPLDEQEVLDTLRRLVERGFDTIAVCLLHSYANASHERTIADIAAKHFPDLLLSLSSDLVPEFREYERMSTTTINAFVRPVVATYLTRFERGVRELGIKAPFVLVQSNGGVVSSDTAKRQPVSLLRSGPAAGVSGAAFVAGLAGERQVITLDIGGTSADVSVFEGAMPSVIRDWEVNTHPVKWTALDIRSIGAGGGSMAWVDAGQMLKVGPDSAGADPGPACYGRGGTNATVTDAHVVLGHIGSNAVLGDSLRIDSGLAHNAVAALGKRIGLSPEDTAAGIIEIVNAGIAQEVHFICAQKGINVRDFTLVAYGGAGPLHASQVAEELGIDKILLPFWPGLVCALGVLATVPKADFAITRLVNLDGDASNLAALLEEPFASLETRAEEWLAEQNIPSKSVNRLRSFDMRYRGQNYELSVPVANGTPQLEDLKDSFHRRHEEAYGFRSTRGVVQIVHMRLSITLDVDHPPLRRQPPTTGTLRAKESRSVHAGRKHGFVSAPVYERDRIPTGFKFHGPTIIEQMDTTILVTPNQSAVVDRWGNLLLEFDRQAL